MPTFTYTPDYGAKSTDKPTVHVTKFGDGYEQRLGEGINLLPKTWDLKFSLRTDSEAAAIYNFFKAQLDTTTGAFSSFDWTDIYSVAGKYVCRQWDRTKDRYNLNTITATFEEVFE